MSGAAVRRIRADEWPRLRDVRLRALADAPLAFGSTHAREAALDDEHWRAWAAAGAVGERSIWLLAHADVAGGPAVGLASGVIDADDPALAHLYSMWVAPEARRTGAATKLIDAVAAWAADRGATRLRTSVAVGNAGAERLYARAGFVDTGERNPLRHEDVDAGAVVAVLTRSLARSREP